MDYSEYEIEDFASDERFIRWVIDKDEDAQRFWDDFQKNHPSLQHKIEKARELLITLRKSEQTLHPPEKASRIWQSIEDGISHGAHKQITSQRHYPLYKIAACLAMIGLTLAVWYGFKSIVLFGDGEGSSRQASNADLFLEEVNTTGNIIRIRLSDGSTVDLHDNSRLRYRKNYSGFPCRQVYLTGEAFFKIAKNPQQPFLVYSNELVTKVLGTSFRVKAFDKDKNILVSVREGKVSVYSSRKKENNPDSILSEVNGVVLNPNQQVVYARTEDSFLKTLIDDPELVRAVNRNRFFAFEDEPVTKVFELLQEAYGVEIIVDKEVMSNCFLTVDLGSEPLFEKLKIVCRTVGAKFELIDARIVISGKGC